MINKIIGKIIDKIIAKKLGVHSLTKVEDFDIVAIKDDPSSSNVCINLKISVKNNELLGLVDKFK